MQVAGTSSEDEEIRGIKPVRANRGRPRDPSKREAVLKASRALFLRDGIDGVTMDRIVAASGIAKATLYSHFADKTAIVEAVIARESERIVSDEWVRDGIAAGTRPALVDFGRRLVTFLAEPEMLDCERLVAQAAKTAPHHGHRFYVAGPGRALTILTRLIEAGRTAGDIDPCDATRAAHDLMGLWQGFWRTEMAFAERPPLASNEIEEIAAHGVHQFLVLYGSKPDRTPADCYTAD